MDVRNDVSSKSSGTIRTTIGDLIEAITEIALQAGKTEAEGYALAQITIEKILRERSRYVMVEQ